MYAATVAALMAGTPLPVAIPPGRMAQAECVAAPMLMSLRAAQPARRDPAPREISRDVLRRMPRCLRLSAL